MKKYIFSLAALAMLMGAIQVKAQNFDDYFVDKTLRVDYTFAGNSNKQLIAVDELNVLPRWYGKKQRLSELPVEGNGQITVRDHRSGKVIYRNSFSTLFQEWLSYPEAKTNTQSFENVFLVPMPKDTVDITLDLRNNRREIMTSLTHQVAPKDILIHHKGDRPTPYETLQEAADTNKCIHIAYVAEGYTEKEMPIFLQDAKEANDAIFAHEPFKSMKAKFNVVAVKSASQDSGTSEPGKGIWKKTALSSHFDTFYSDRYLTTLHLKDLHDCLAGTPYEHIIVLVNSTRYGGGGILNSYNLTTCHQKWFKPVVVHEFGHSFAGLADEYAYESEDIPMYPHYVEPWEKNITTLVDFDSKWKSMVKKGTPIPTPLSKKAKEAVSKIGVFEGAGYSVKGVYRGVQDCRMRINETPDFCPVCKQALTDIIDFYTK